MTYTEQAIEATRALLIEANQRGKNVVAHDLTFTPKGYIYTSGGTRTSTSNAVQVVAASIEKANTPKAKVAKDPNQVMAWGKLNANTQAFFFELCEAMQAQTQDAGMTVPARIGKHGIIIPLAKCPLLTNLKKAGMLEGVSGQVKSHRYVVLTDLGRATWQAYV